MCGEFSSGAERSRPLCVPLSARCTETHHSNLVSCDAPLQIAAQALLSSRDSRSLCSSSPLPLCSLSSILCHFLQASKPAAPAPGTDNKGYHYLFWILFGALALLALILLVFALRTCWAPRRPSRRRTPTRRRRVGLRPFAGEHWSSHHARVSCPKPAPLQRRADSKAAQPLEILQGSSIMWSLPSCMVVHVWEQALLQ